MLETLLRQLVLIAGSIQIQGSGIVLFLGRQIIDVLGTISLDPLGCLGRRPVIGDGVSGGSNPVATVLSPSQHRLTLLLNYIFSYLLSAFLAIQYIVKDYLSIRPPSRTSLLLRILPASSLILCY